MKIETLKDVLHWTSEFHKRLSGCLEDSGEGTSERVKLLLDYLEKHEDRLARIISQFEQKASISALNTWCYEYFDKNPVVPHRLCEKPHASLSPEEITAIVLDLHGQVVGLYRYILAQNAAESASELLRNLIALEEHEAMQMAQGANRLEDE